MTKPIPQDSVGTWRAYVSNQIQMSIDEGITYSDNDDDDE